MLEKSLKLLEEKRDDFISKADEIRKQLESIGILDGNIITYRVKSKTSLEEKIHRRDLLEKYGSAEEMISSLDDIIGIRIITLLHGYEKNIWNQIKAKCNSINVDGDTYLNINETKIFLEELDLPVEQKNKHEIYKISCFYGENKNVGTRFELQIKSLIHLLWGEVEHMLFYKNYDYVINSSFNTEIMNNTYSHLKNLDKQLEFIKEHMIEQSGDNKKNELLRIVSKILHEKLQPHYRKKYKIDYDYRKVVDSVVFLALQSKYSQDIEDMIEGIPEIILSMQKLNSQEIFKIEKYNKTLGLDIVIQTQEELRKKYSSDKNTRQIINIFNIINKSDGLEEVSKEIHNIYTYEDNIDLPYDKVKDKLMMALRKTELNNIRSYSIAEIIARKKSLMYVYDNMIIDFQETIEEDINDISDLEDFTKYIESLLETKIALLMDKRITNPMLKKLISSSDNSIWLDPTCNSNLDKINDLVKKNDYKNKDLYTLIEGDRL
jgi:ppGpp synthetase/RelA/SpoT-type nucleotidyltranferase